MYCIFPQFFHEIGGCDCDLLKDGYYFFAALLINLRKSTVKKENGLLGVGRSM